MKASMLIFTVETVETDQLTANLEVKNISTIATENLWPHVWLQ